MYPLVYPDLPWWVEGEVMSWRGKPLFPVRFASWEGWKIEKGFEDRKG